MYSAVASCLVGIFPPTAAHFASFSCEQSHSRNLAHASLFSDPLQTPKFSPPIVDVEVPSSPVGRSVKSYSNAPLIASVCARCHVPHSANAAFPAQN